VTPAPKPGAKTTEFWLAAVSALGGSWAVIGNESDAVKVTLIVCFATLGAGYVIGRSIIKKAATP